MGQDKDREITYNYHQKKHSTWGKMISFIATYKQSRMVRNES